LEYLELEILSFFHAAERKTGDAVVRHALGMLLDIYLINSEKADSEIEWPSGIVKEIEAVRAKR